MLRPRILGEGKASPAGRARGTPSVLFYRPFLRKVVRGMAKLTIFLDYDETLNDSHGLLAKSFQGFLGMDGADIKREFDDVHEWIVTGEHTNHHEDIEFHLEHMVRRLGHDNQKSRDEAMRRFKEGVDNTIHARAIFDDALPFLRALEKMDVTVCLATGDYAKEKAESIEKALGKRIFAKYFDAGITGFYKRDGGFYPRAMEIAGVKPAASLSIGDSPERDIAPAKAAGMSTIWLARNGQSYPKALAAPDNSVRTLTEAAVLISGGFGSRVRQ